MMTTSYLSLVRVEASNHILRYETMRAKMFCCHLFLILVFVVCCCHLNYPDRDFISEDQKCTRKAEDQDQENKETLKKEENEAKEVQQLRLRFPRFLDVSAIY